MTTAEIRGSGDPGSRVPADDGLLTLRGPGGPGRVGGLGRLRRLGKARARACAWRPGSPPP
jgi:hypothetical protein